MKIKKAVRLLFFSVALAEVLWVFRLSLSAYQDIRNVVLISIDTCRAYYDSGHASKDQGP
jgi:hypothetical protein